MGSSIPRPVPRGLNVRGLPLWDGTELALFRQAHAVTQVEVARALGVTHPAIATTYEPKKLLVTRAARIEEYFKAIERIAARRAETAAKASEELNAYRRAFAMTLVQGTGR